MAKSDEKIPTLTQVVTAGDDEMLNHFNSKPLNINKAPLKKAARVENATDIENLEVKDLPSLTAEHATTTKLPANDLQMDKTDIKNKINQAIKEALPGIEKELKSKLYKKFGV